jgi:hypothetical protein
MAVQQEAVGHVDPYIQALGLALNLDEMELHIAPVLSELERVVDLAINDTPEDDRYYHEVWVQTSAEFHVWLKNSQVVVTQTKPDPGGESTYLFDLVIEVDGSGFDLDISSGYTELAGKVEYFDLTTSLVEPSEDHMAEIRSAVTDFIKSSAGKLLAKRL